MCGIAGLFNSQPGATFDRTLVEKMAAAIAHRGPDSEGFHFADGVALAHRRLSIIDLSTGAQPMFSDDRSLVVVFNGEIYNFQELRSELAARGHIFNTRSDTEVILNGWREWGGACVKRFKGMFAFALWDERKQTFFLARDHLGKKPLYYAMDARRLAFASELPALTPCPWISRRIAPEAIEEYLCFGYVPDPKTIYRGVHKLPPAHTLLWERGRPPVIASYWDLDLTPTRSLTMEAAASELCERLNAAVSQRLISDVPLGAFLSGGVDSSAVVAHMAQASSTPVKTCTIGFGEASHDERRYARILAMRYGADHSERVVPAEFLSADDRLLDRVAAVYGEPFADNSAVPTFQVCAIARQRVTVALSGDGGDEAFGGYRRYRWHIHEQSLRSVLPQSLRGPMFGWLARIYPQLARAPRFLRAKSTFRDLAQDAAEAYTNNMALIPGVVRDSIYAPAFRQDLQGYRASSVLKQYMAAAPADNPLLQAQYTDMKTWLAGRMLVKVDRASMANGLEVRSPFLDYELFQWGVSLPTAFKVTATDYKVVLKKSLEPLVPRELLYRTKQGFGVPMAAWLRGPLEPLLRRSLSAPILHDTGYFQPQALMKLADDHISGAADHASTLWTLIMLERFLAREAGEVSATSSNVADDQRAEAIGHR
jgi:asparagine synthase (glutamine-hydrolysing)